MTVGGQTAMALSLDFLYPDRELNAEEISRDGAALIAALEDQRDARFVVQTTCFPDVDRPERGRLEVHLIVIDAGMDSERRSELLDDLEDLLSAPPLRWSFSPVESESDLLALVEPFEPAHVAEVARREEPCLPTDRVGGVGFGEDSSTREVMRELWSLSDRRMTHVQNAVPPDPEFRSASCPFLFNL